MGGVAISKLSNNEVVTINSDVTNSYLTDEQTDTGPLFGLGLLYEFEGLAHHHLGISLGLSGYYINYGYVSGLELPFINAGSDFDTLDYRFKLKSYALMFEPKIIYTKWEWQPYLFAGVGSSWNRAYRYNEEPSDPSLTAAAASPFESHTMNTVAYEVGVGLRYEFDKKPTHHLRYFISADYRYMNMGHAELGNRENEATEQHLEVDPLYTQAVVIALTARF